jgi:putative DNA methylase
MSYPKRLIEVDLPIKRISYHSGKEKNMRQGHISSLHIWWARRPLAACRAVLCASLWPDPADPLCPKEFIEFAQKEMIKWSGNEHLPLLSKESIEHFIKVNHDQKLVENKSLLRTLLLDFIADFSDWANSNKLEFLTTSRLLTEKAHTYLTNSRDSLPLVVDPFAGGGAFPFEAARISTESYAGDLNALAITLNKVVLEHAPQFQTKLLDLIREYSRTFKNNLEPQLKVLYPENKKGEIPICYFYARTVQCEGPNCGLEVPIVKTYQFATTKGNEASIEFYYENRELKSRVHTEKTFKKHLGGTSKRSSVTCPSCNFTTARKNVEKQAVERGFGYHLFAVCERKADSKYKYYRSPGELEDKSFQKTEELYNYLSKENIPNTDINSFPSEELPYLRSIFNVRVYGIDQWQKLFTKRQLVATVIQVNEFRKIAIQIKKDIKDVKLQEAVITCLGLVISNSLQYQCNIATYLSDGIKSAFIQGQSLGMKMDFVEANPLMPDLAGGFDYSNNKFLSGIEYLSSYEYSSGHAIYQSALTPFLADDSVDLLVTDPPYYDVIPYADCSDFFYVWLKRMFAGIINTPFNEDLSRKEEEIVQLSERNEKYKLRTKDWFESKMSESLANWRVATKPKGLAVIVFAHKETNAWEALLKAVLDAGWVITASWPVDTENSTRMRANDSAVLNTSVHLVCRPRENHDGSLIHNQIGDWRDVQQELPKRIHEWMPRLAAEGVAGADAIFACLGPALEVFSRYSSVEKPNGDVVTLREYLEKVWAAVSQEALNMVFTGGEAQGLEEDARLTAMWLWTLTAGASDTAASDDEEESDDEESSSSGKLSGGFTLEYDTARKIAQGLGANLEDLKTLVEVKGDKARLLPVMERTSKLFGSAGMQQQPVKKKKKVQLSLSFENVEPEAETKFEMPELKVEQTGKTVLDRLHQAMLLFSTGRTEALKRFLVEDGAGKDDRFWKLAQSLTSLYPKDTDERRWVEAVQTYKKSLGF